VTAVQVSPGRSAATAELDHPAHRFSALVKMANQIGRQFAADTSADPIVKQQFATSSDSGNMKCALIWLVQLKQER
jgi:hypothetical protein